MWRIAKETGRPLHPAMTDVLDWPHTLTTVIGLRSKYDSFFELPEVPPEEWWDFPSLIRRHIDKLYPNSKNKSSTDVDLNDIEG